MGGYYYNGSYIWFQGVDGTCLAQDRVKQQALMNTSMDLQVPKKAGNFLIS
jgi:hypothetical protein